MVASLLSLCSLLGLFFQLLPPLPLHEFLFAPLLLLSPPLPPGLLPLRLPLSRGQFLRFLVDLRLLGLVLQMLPPLGASPVKTPDEVAIVDALPFLGLRVGLGLVA